MWAEGHLHNNSHVTSVFELQGRRCALKSSGFITERTNRTAKRLTASRQETRSVLRVQETTRVFASFTETEILLIRGSAKPTENARFQRFVCVRITAALFICKAELAGTLLHSAPQMRTSRSVPQSQNWAYWLLLTKSQILSRNAASTLNFHNSWWCHLNSRFLINVPAGEVGLGHDSITSRVGKEANRRFNIVGLLWLLLAWQNITAQAFCSHKRGRLAHRSFLPLSKFPSSVRDIIRGTDEIHDSGEKTKSL